MIHVMMTRMPIKMSDVHNTLPSTFNVTVYYAVSVRQVQLQSSDLPRSRCYRGACVNGENKNAILAINGDDEFKIKDSEEYEH